MSSIKNRVFGSDIPNEIKAKLFVRQQLAGEHNTSDSTIDGVSFGETIGEMHFDGMADLSSRTPFARMWTAVQIYDPAKYGAEEIMTEHIDPETKPENRSSIEYANRLWAEDYKSKGYKVYKKDGKWNVQKKLQAEIQYDTVIYTIGDNTLNTLSVEANALVLGDNKLGKSLTGGGTLTGKDIAPGENETNSNEFMKPQAGITSVSMTTDGPLGSLKRTTVNFKVHNFHDFDKIYSRFFLKPGAQIFIDFGWDTSTLYNLEEIIVGDVQGSIDEVVERSKGDLEVLVGHVVNYDAKFTENGSVECSVEVVSKNTALIGTNYEDNKALKSRINISLENEIIQFALNHFPGDVAVKLTKADWQRSTTDKEHFETQFNKFAAERISSKKNIPNEASMQSGVFWYGAEKSGAGEGEKSIYISFGLFEDKILNREFAFGDKDEIVKLISKDGVRFDSSNSFIRWNDDLFKRQLLVGTSDTVSFILPETWDETYNTRRGKSPNRANRTQEFLNNTYLDPLGESYDLNDPEGVTYEGTEAIGTDEFESSLTNTKLDKETNRMPLRELFISVNLIKRAFEETNDVGSLLKRILDTVNDDSSNVFKLSMYSGTKDAQLSIIDSNKLDVDDDIFKKLFVFKPNSKNSIVKNFDFSLSTPQGNIGNMIAISGRSPGTSIFPVTDFIDRMLAMEVIEQKVNKSEDDESESIIGVRYFPEIGDNADKFEYQSSLEPGLDLDFVSDDLKVFGDVMVTNEAINTININSAETFRALDGYETEPDYKETENEEKDNSEKQAADDKANGLDVVSSLKEYFDRHAKRNSMQILPTILPIKVSLSIHGISSLIPGDLFRIDYLPQKYREYVYFQITKVSHDISSSTWTTTLETVMRLNPLEKEKSPDIYKLDEEIVLDKRILKNGPTKCNAILNDWGGGDWKYGGGGFNVIRRLRLDEASLRGSYNYIKYVFNFVAEKNFTINRFPVDWYNGGGYGYKTAAGPKLHDLWGIKLVKDEIYRLIINRKGTWIITEMTHNINDFDHNVDHEYCKDYDCGSASSANIFNEECNVCYECGKGLWDNCEKDECNTNWCDFVDNLGPFNTCKPRNDVCYSNTIGVTTGEAGGGAG